MLKSFLITVEVCLHCQKQNGLGSQAGRKDEDKPMSWLQVNITNSVIYIAGY